MVYFSSVGHCYVFASGLLLGCVCAVAPSSGCASSDEPRHCTTMGETCVFPFTYAGVEFNSCTTQYSDDGKRWCGIVADVNDDASTYGSCGPCHETFLFTDPGLDPVTRTFVLQVPESYKPGQPSPLALIFHGWGESGEHFHDMYGDVAEKHGYVAVYSDGLADCADGETCNPSWNGVGTSQSDASKHSCNMDIVKTNYCHKSCQVRKGGCHPCDWTTCYDDVAFAAALLDQLEERFCLDKKRLFAAGCSNGGVFTHQLARRMPNRLAAIASSCGGKPHKGWEIMPDNDGSPISALVITGNRDDVIPLDGKDVSGWIYATDTEVMAAYKNYNSCSNIESGSYHTEHTTSGMVCTEHGFDCAGGTSAVSCVFNGGHEFNMAVGSDEFPDEIQIVFEFLDAHPKLATWPVDHERCATTYGGTCVFPFTYNGAEYSSCTEEDSDGKPWCGVVADATDTGNTWGYCNSLCAGRETESTPSPTLVTTHSTTRGSLMLTSTTVQPDQPDATSPTTVGSDVSETETTPSPTFVTTLSDVSYARHLLLTFTMKLVVISVLYV